MRALAVLAAVALLALPALAASEATHQVAMRNSRYDPAVLQVKVGDTVTWTHFDGPISTHTVTSYVDGTLASPNLQTGQKFSHTFTEPAIIAYHCLFHAAMNGVIVVQA